VERGVVSLRGTVPSISARRAAAADARNTIGVSSVRDRMRVRPDDNRTDAAVADAVRNALTRDPAIERHDVAVSVRRGTAYLYGTVDNYYEKAIVDDLVARVSGVTDVKNSLGVRSESWVGYNPFLGDPYLYGFDWYDYTPRHTWMSDEQIADEIRSQLWWSPFVDQDEVNVKVNDGVATLTGMVDSWSEFRAAAENAYEGGAVWVDNNLLIESR
jgi:osmotically-inducible protein OsmY